MYHDLGSGGEPFVTEVGVNKPLAKVVLAGWRMSSVDAATLSRLAMTTPLVDWFFQLWNLKQVTAHGALTALPGLFLHR